MKNDKAMDLSQLAANGNALDLVLAEVRGEVKVKRLRTRHARKGEGWSKANGGGRVVGAANGANGVTTGNRAAAGGGQMTITGQCGQGAQMVADLDAVKAKYARVKNAERAEYVREQAEILRAEREAAAFAALDDLLSEV
jgi:hypothetical protein